MEPKFIAETTFNLKNRIDMVRVFMGRAYYGFLLVAGAVICYNYYLINSGQAVEGDTKKTAMLFILMLIWGFIPVAAGFVWDKLSKVKYAKISVYEKKLTVTTNINSFDLEPKRFYTIVQKEHYIKLGPIKQTVIINTDSLNTGEADKLTSFLINMKND